jgi:hypothetical protein
VLLPVPLIGGIPMSLMKVVAALILTAGVVACESTKTPSSPTGVFVPTSSAGSQAAGSDVPTGSPLTLSLVLAATGPGSSSQHSTVAWAVQIVESSGRPDFVITSFDERFVVGNMLVFGANSTSAMSISVRPLATTEVMNHRQDMLVPTWGSAGTLTAKVVVRDRTGALTELTATSPISLVPAQ